MTQGRVNTNHTLETQGISGLGEVYYNLMEPDIIAEAPRRK
jgi:phosphoenolpyruvate carboxykinase (ATP)